MVVRAALLIAMALLAAPLAHAQQQPETLSLMKEPLYPPPISPEIRDKLQADLATAKTALQKQPGNIDATLAAARADMGLGHVGDAIEALTRSLEVHPDEPHLLLERGRDLIVLRKYDAAERDIRKAGDLPASTCALAFVEYLKMQYKQAAETYPKCQNPGIFAYLADRFSGGSKVQRPAIKAEDLPPTAPPINLPGSVVRKTVTPERSVPASYLDAAERLASGKKAEAKDLLRQIVEKHTDEWMTPAYIAAETDYSRLAKPTPHKSKKKKKN
jgi:tetratricopeptide (TPR) repeat protein